MPPHNQVDAVDEPRLKASVPVTEALEHGPALPANSRDRWHHHSGWSFGAPQAVAALEQTENVVAGKLGGGVLQQGPTDDHGPGREVIRHHQPEAEGLGGQSNRAPAEERVSEGEIWPKRLRTDAIDQAEDPRQKPPLPAGIGWQRLKKGL